MSSTTNLQSLSGLIGKLFSIESNVPTANIDEFNLNEQSVESLNLIKCLRKYCGIDSSYHFTSRSNIEDLLDSNGFHYRLSEIDNDKIKYEQVPLIAVDRESNDHILILKKGSKTSVYVPKYDKYISKKVSAIDIFDSVYEVFPVFPFELNSFWKLIKFSFPAIRPDFFKAVLLSILVTLFSLASPIITSRVVGDVVPSGNIAWIISTFVISIVIAVYSSILTWIQSYYLLRLNQKLNIRIQVPLYHRILSYPVSFLDQYNVGDLSSRATAVNTILTSLSSTSLSTLISMVSLIGFAGLMMFYNFTLSIPALLYIALIGVIQTLVLRKQLASEKSLVEVKASYYEESLQSISTAALTRTSGNELSVLRRWSSIIFNFTSLSFNVSRLSSINQILSKFLSTLGNSLIYGVLVYQLYNATSLSDVMITTSSFIVFTSAFQNFSSKFLEIINVVNTVFGQTLVQLKRTYPLIRQQPERGLKYGGFRRKLTGLIEFKNVTFTYPGSDKIILDNVSFSLKPGAFNVLFGPSGCGKSTILSILIGFYPIKSGSVFIDGVEIDNLDIKYFRSQIGTILQSPTLPPSSIRDALTSGIPTSEEKIWQSLETVNLTSEIQSLPMKLETILSEGASNISGGQRQRLCIARALLSRPRMLLEDESTSALDNRSQKIIVNNIKDIGITRVVVAHRMSAIRNCDHMVVIVDGKVEATGNYDYCANHSRYLASVLSKDSSSSL